MTNSAADAKDDPAGRPLTHTVEEGTPELRHGLTAKEWDRVEALFDRMAESPDPAAILSEESDPPVVQAAERLYRAYVEVESNGFLDSTVTLVRQFRGTQQLDAPQFSPGQELAGRFLIESFLGMGGMGEVYSARYELLHERVAIKTIRATLAHDPAIRRRFVGEVQSARRVTHRNVCRIFDLFEHEGTPFFTMEFLEGVSLTQWLRQPHPPAVRRHVALELALGLHAAHLNNILHCDFKPANVILTNDSANPTPVITDFGLARAFTGQTTANRHSLQGGTVGYMAPELLKGSPATVRTDIYALGKVTLELLPNYRPAMDCIAQRPEERPASLEPLIGKLRGGISGRRSFLLLAGGLGVGAAGAGAYLSANHPRLIAGSHQRMALNAFRPEKSAAASLLHDLLITALRQSLLVTVVANERLRSALSRNHLSAHMPALHADLLAAAEHEGIVLVMEGTLSGEGVARFLFEIYRPGESRAALSLAEPIPSQSAIVSAAERIASRLRTEFGESAVLQSGYVSLDRLVSASAEAAGFYFRGVGLYESAQADAAIDWFDQAIRVDPQFALAHLSRGIALAARYRWFSAIPSYQRAFDLRSRVSERERFWIEGSYYNIVGNYVNSLDSFRRLVALYPDEPVFQRNTAFAYSINGRPVDALPYNRRAVELDPGDVNNADELIVNLAVAGRYDEALQGFDRFRQDGISSTLLARGAGLAWMAKGDLERASESFERMGTDAVRERWARLLQCAPLILQGRFEEAASRLEADIAWDVATGEQSHLVSRRIWLGRLHLLMDAPAVARRQAVELLRLDVSPASLDGNREAALIAHAAGDGGLAHAALINLREIEGQWPSTHTSGVRAHVEAVLGNAAEAAGPFTQAVGLWADPLLLLSRAQWLRAIKDPSGALAACEELDQQEGRLLKLYFPGLLVLGWLERARSLAALSRFGDALRVYDRIRKSWSGAGKFSVMRQAAAEMDRIQR
ncbi:MAG: serine/threonine-protein kinase [Bryobacteraceae bacterium]